MRSLKLASGWAVSSNGWSMHAPVWSYFQKKESVEGIPLEDYEKYPLLKARLKAFRHCYGQPPEVRRAFEQAMGIAQ